MTTFESLLPLLQATGLPHAGPFATPSACLAALRGQQPDAVDSARWVAIPTDTGMVLAGHEGEGLPPAIERTTLAQLTDKREKGDLLTVLRSIDLGASQVLFDRENLAYLPSPPAAEAWLLRRPGRHADARTLRRFGLWITRGERGVAIFAPSEDALLVASIRLRLKGLQPKRYDELYSRHQLPAPRALPPFDDAIADEMAAMLQETAPGPRRSLANYLAYLGAHRCLVFARLAVELAANPEWDLAQVQGKLAEVGLAEADAADQRDPAEDPRVGSNGPRSVGGICFRLLSRWVGRRLAGWIEYQG